MARWERAYLAEAIAVDDFQTKRTEILARRKGIAGELAHLDEQQQLID